MSKVENLLLTINPKNKKNSFQKKDNFLFNLITNLKDSKKLLSILKDMNITQKELNNLLEKKTTPIEIKEKIKILINNLKEKEVKEENTLVILQNIINKPISNNELEKKVNNNPSLKKEIINAKIKLNKILLNEKEIKEFKKIKTFKKLIEYANKKELNISKIIISSFNHPKIENKINNIILSTENILNKFTLKQEKNSNIEIKQLNKERKNRKNSGNKNCST